MICKECGARIYKTSVFCSKCGVRVAPEEVTEAASEPVSEASDETVQETEAVQESETVQEDKTVSAEETVAGEDGESGGDDFDRYFEADNTTAGTQNGKYRIMAVIAAVAVIFLVCFCNTNTFKRTFYKPVDYYRYVEKKSAEKKIDFLTAWYKNSDLSNGKAKTIGGESTVGLKISDDFIEMLENATGEDDLEFLGDVSISSKSTVYSGKTGNNVAYNIGGDQVLTLNMITDSEDGTVYLRIPELSDAYIEFDGEGTTVSYDHDAMIKATPSAKSLKKILKRYSDIVIENITDVEKVKKETLEIEGVKQKCYVITADLNKKDVKNIIETLRENLESDEEVENIVKGVAEAFGENGEDAYDLVFRILEEYEDMAKGLDDTEIRIFVDSHGNIIGREISCDGNTLMNYGLAIKGRTYGAEFAMYNEEGREELGLRSNGRKSGAKFSGDLTLSVSDISNITDITMVIDSFDCKGLKNQRINAQISVDADDVTELFGIDDNGMLRDYLAIITIKSPSSSSSAAEIRLTDGKEDALILSCQTRKAGGSKITLPEDAIEVKDASGLKKYIDDADFDRVKKNLRNAGVPKKYVKYVDTITDMAEYLDYVDIESIIKPDRYIDRYDDSDYNVSDYEYDDNGDYEYFEEDEY